MTEPRFSAQPDPERYALDLFQIDALYAAAGRPAPGAVPHPLIYYASSKTVIELLDALLQVARAPRHPRCEDERTRLCSALDAFEEIVEAIRRYDVDRRFQPPPSTEGRKALRRLADRPTRKSLESLLARNDLRPDYLSALWLAAIELGLLRMSAGAVEVQRSWHRTGYAEDDWLLALAEEPASLRAIARKATEEFSVPKSGHLRPFRELRSEPDGNKFLRLIAKPPGASGESIPLLMARYAARKLYGGDLPADWAQQIARDPVLIKKMARLVCACRLFRHAIRGTGPVPDAALDAYGQALCAIYERVAGQPVTYGTRMNLEAKPPQAERTGLGLGFVRAGVKLIDPATSLSQAQRHIDRRERVPSISGFQSGEQDRSSSGEASPRGAQDADASLMRKALEEGCEALHEAAASFIAASKSVTEEFNRSAERHIAASDEAVEVFLKAASESSERFAAVAHQAAESLREVVVGLSEASKELSRVAREAGEALKKDAKSAADEIPQAGKNSDTAAVRGGDGPRKKKSVKAAGSSRESNGHRRKSARSNERRAH